MTDPVTDENDVLFEVIDGAIARITLNTPDMRNAPRLGRGPRLHKAFERAIDDPAVRAIVFTGAGGHFSAGGNVKGFAGREPVEIVASVRGAQGLARLVAQGDKPVVAAVEGFAAGAGVGMACLCDIIVADPAAKFVLPFSRIGMVPDMGLHFTLGQRVGQARARRIMLMSETIAAEEGERLGLVDYISAPGQAQERALEVARHLAGLAPGAMASLRRGFNVAAAALEAVLDYEAVAMTVAMSGQETREGVAAFLEKRRPVFGPAGPR